MMDNNEKFGLWQFETIYKYNDHTELIMNQISRQLMIRKTMSDSEYKVHKALCGISHKNIIRILDAVSDSGVCIVIEQFVSGVTLKTFCERAKPDDDIIIEMALQLCRGLSVLHKNNIVHRDITPTNIMIDDYGILKIIDFDISRMPNEKARKDTHILGTEGYAAPEQFGFGQSTFQTDIYSVGILLNYMKTGKTPDEKTLSDTSILPDIIRKCTAFEPKNRYQSIEELMADLYRYRDAAAEGMTVKKPDKKEPLLETIIGSLPGVKSRYRIVRFFALSGYAMFVLWLFSVLGSAQNRSDLLKAVINLIFMIIIPFVCFFNYLSFQNKIFPKYSLYVKRAIFCIMGILSFFSSVVIGQMIK